MLFSLENIFGQYSDSIMITMITTQLNTDQVDADLYRGGTSRSDVFLA